MRKATIMRIKAFACFIFALGLIATLMYFVSYYDSHYNRDAEIVKVSGSEVLAMDNCGNTWTFEADGLNEKDIVVLKMFNNCTDNNPYDDEIIDVKVIRSAE